MQNNQTAGETAIQKFNSEQFGVIRTAGTAEKRFQAEHYR